MSSHSAMTSLLPHFLSIHTKLYWITLLQHTAVCLLSLKRKEMRQAGEINELAEKQQQYVCMDCKFSCNGHVEW